MLRYMYSAKNLRITSKLKTITTGVSGAGSRPVMISGVSGGESRPATSRVVTGGDARYDKWG